MNLISLIPSELTDSIVSLLDRPTLCINAVCGGNIDIVEWLKERGDNLEDTDFDITEYVDEIAEHGHIDMLEWLRNNGYPWNGLVFVKAIDEGHFDKKLFWG